MAITQARTLGARGFIIPSAGNAGGAAAVYAAALRAAVRGDRAARHAAGGHRRGRHRRRARLHDRGLDRHRRQGRGPGSRRELGWFDLSTLKEPYRLEGKKTMGLELAEQLDWTHARRAALPDRRRHRAGRHPQGLRGAARHGLGQRRAAALLRRPGRGLRADGQGVSRRRRDDGTPWENPTTHAAGLRVPSPFAGRQMLRILRESGGDAVAVSERAIDRGAAPAGPARRDLDLARGRRR